MTALGVFPEIEYFAYLNNLIGFEGLLEMQGCDARWEEPLTLSENRGYEKTRSYQQARAKPSQSQGVLGASSCKPSSAQG